MRNLLVSFLCLLITVGANAQAGLSQGQAVEQTTANPTTSGKKHCPHCGISMGNVT